MKLLVGDALDLRAWYLDARGRLWAVLDFTVKVLEEPKKGRLTAFQSRGLGFLVW